jgi:hypothetical protein
MQNVSDASEIGGFAGFDYNNWFVSMEFLADAGNAHEGWLGSTYFGVTGPDSARSGLRTFDADEGLKDVGFDLGILCQFNQNWGGRLLGGYKLLLNDADESSPVTNEGSQHQLFGGFWWSTRFNRQLSADIGLESYRFYSG